MNETERQEIYKKLNNAQRALGQAESAIAQLKNQLDESAKVYVQVLFAGCSKRYCYHVIGEHVRVGDYVRVHSNYTNKKEIVKVVALGRGYWTGATKEAQLLPE